MTTAKRPAAKQPKASRRQRKAPAKPAEKPENNKGGRPTLYTPEIVEAICERLSKGEPLAAICRDDGMPADRTVRDWVAAKEDVSAAIAHAREAGEDWLAAECLKIADDGRNDYVERERENGKKMVVPDSEHIQRSKLRIETRLKLLAKWNPKKYGDRLELDGSLNLQTTPDEKLDDRIASIVAGIAGQPAASE